MRIVIVTPAPPGSRRGNRITALRWARLLRQLGHEVHLRETWRGEVCDVLVALHAGRAAGDVARWRDARPDAPLVLALTGTDVYDEIHRSEAARRSLALATRLVVLQRLAIDQLPEAERFKARTIWQSTRLCRPLPRGDAFDVAVLGHLRRGKDPVRTALAARLLPPSSRLRVVHLGAALTPDEADAARAESATNPRYTWLGEVPRSEALRTLRRCQLLSLTSLMEGGANVVTEAIALGV